MKLAIFISKSDILGGFAVQEYKITPIERLISVKSVITAFNAERQKGYYFSGEMHNFWELVYVVSGRVMATADEKVLTLEAGQLLFHKPMEFHRIWSTADSVTRLAIISFEAEGEAMRYFENAVISITPAEGERFTDITASFKKVLRGSGNEKFYRPEKMRLIANRSICELEDFLLGLIGRDSKLAKERDPEVTQYEYIVGVLSEHINENLTQEDIARLCNFSVSNLKRIFHKYSDIGIMKYFTSIKLRRAMQLLLRGRAIVEIADELGFSSTNYFHAVFKRETGLTPKEYIESNRNTVR